jgi:hypothetical protein
VQVRVGTPAWPIRPRSPVSTSAGINAWAGILNESKMPLDLHGSGFRQAQGGTPDLAVPQHDALDVERIWTEGTRLGVDDAIAQAGSTS